jgi:hypothetical protein
LWIVSDERAEIWDYDYWPPHRQPPTIEYTRDRRGVYVPRRQRRPIGFPTCFILTAIVVVVLLRFFWPAFLLLFIFAGVDSPSTMLTMIVGLVILAAVALRERLNGRRF